MNRLLDLASPEQAGEVRQFLTELPEIRSRRLAFNRGVTFGDAFAVATPLLAPDGSLIAAISAAVDASEADRLDEIGEQLKKAIPLSALNTASNRAERPASQSSIPPGTRRNPQRRRWTQATGRGGPGPTGPCLR